MMPTDTQYLNHCSGYVSRVKQLQDLVGEFRGLRTQADVMGYSLPAVVSQMEFPLSGDLSHITSADQYLAFLAGIEALFAAMSQPVTYTGADGQPQTTAAGPAIYRMGR